MKLYVKASKDLSSKEALIQILKDIKDRVIVTGSYAYGMQTDESDIDFFVKWVPEEDRDKIAEETGADYWDIPETYCKELIKYFESKGYSWDSVFVDSFSVDDTYIPLEFSSFYNIDEEHTFTVNILGVTMEAAKSTHTSDKYLNGIKRSKLKEKTHDN